MMGYYDKEGNQIDLTKWTSLVEDAHYRFVGYADLGPVRISTIWLGLNVGEGDLNIFETNVFDNEVVDSPPLAIPEGLELPETLKNSKLVKGGYPMRMVLPEYTRSHSTLAQAQQYHEETVAKVAALFSITEEALQQLAEQDNT